MSWFFAGILSLLPCLLSSRSFDHREKTHAADSFTWKFGEINHLIECDNNNIDALRKELPHFVLYLNRKTTSHGKQRLYELTHIAKKMKEEIHPIPIARTEDHDLLQKYTDGSDHVIRYVYFRHGEAIPYHRKSYKFSRIESY